MSDMFGRALVFVVVVSLARAHVQRVCQMGKNPINVQLNYVEESAVLQVRMATFASHVAYYQLELMANFTYPLDQVDCKHRIPMLPHSSFKKLSIETNFSAEIGHVYSGVYRIALVPWTDLGSGPSKLILLKITNPRTMPNIGEWNTTFLLHPFPLRHTITVEFEPASLDFGFQSYEVMLFRGVDHCEQTEHSGTHFSCETYHETPSCTFHNLEPGAYCALLRPVDDRCAYGTAWLIEDYCTVYSDIVYLSEMKLLPSTTIEVVKKESRDVFLPSAAVVIVFLLVIVFVVPFTMMRLYRRLSERRVRQFAPLERMISKTVAMGKSAANRSVLLLWIPENDQLSSAVSKLKETLVFQHGFRVLDVYAESLYDSIVQDPVQWMSAAVTDTDTQIIIIRSALLEDYVKGKVLVGPQPFEHLVVFGLKQLLVQRAITQTLYTSTFLVSFADLATESALMNNFTPFRCFVLPDHIDELMRYLNM